MKDSEYQYIVYKREDDGTMAERIGSFKGYRKIEDLLNSLDDDEEVFHISDKEVILRKHKSKIP